MLDRAVRLRRSQPPTLATTLFLGALLILLLAACQPVRPVAATGAAAPMAEISIASAANLMVSPNDTLGDFLVDDKGMTLYLFTKDEPGVSNCYDQCAEHWPPLLTAGRCMPSVPVWMPPYWAQPTAPTAPIQVTYNGWPLYYWWKDTAPGDTTGQDVGDVWFVVTPAGEMVGYPTIKKGKTEALGDFLVDSQRHDALSVHQG